MYAWSVPELWCLDVLGYTMSGDVDSWLTCEQFAFHLLTFRFVHWLLYSQA